MNTDLKLDYNNPDYYDNREISWLSFNQLVLQEAEDKRNPLLERLGFLAIGSSNLDEFMMVRVAGLQDQFHMGVNMRDSKKQWTAEQQLEEISKVNNDNVTYQYQLYYKLAEELKAEGIFFKHMNELSEESLKKAKHTFDHQIYPALTPLGIDAYRPFPNLNNKVINIFVNLKRGDEYEIAIVPIPQLVNRFFYVEGEDDHYLVYGEEIIQHFIGKLFRGYEVTSSFFFRITRNADLDIHEEGAEDLLTVIEDYLKKRRNGIAVRLEIDIRHTNHDMLTKDIEYLTSVLELQGRDLYFIDGPLDLTALSDAVDLLESNFPELVNSSFTPVYPIELVDIDLFKYTEKQDLFLHHPYDSFDPVVEFIDKAADDPDTISIKQTLYRVSNNSPIVAALKRAAENGKQVTALVELKARFDEENNVQWAKVLEEAGCHVIYGKTHLKTHSKIALVVKRQKGLLKRWVHLGTGNYNDKTAYGYTDMGIITTNDDMVEDATDFFNYLSGYANQPNYKHLHVSPFEIRDSYIEDIQAEIDIHKEHGNGHIIAKMNSLTSKDIIKKLYEASQSGVKVDLIIRGICCLVPGIPGLSDNIRVISIVGRFLEHSRIYYFYNNGQEKLFLSSADMMTRNMIKRVEIEFPILDENIKRQIIEILEVYLDDNVKGRYKLADSSYHYVTNDKDPISAQDVFMVNANQREESEKSTAKTSWLRRLQQHFRANDK